MTSVLLAAGFGMAVAPGVASAARTPAHTTPVHLAKDTEKTGIVPGTVIAVLSGDHVTGARIAARTPLSAAADAVAGGPDARKPLTSSAPVNAALARFGASWIRPLFPELSAQNAHTLTLAAGRAIGTSALNLGDLVVIHLTKGNASTAATALEHTSGISFAEPDRYVNTMNTGAQAIPASMKASMPAVTATRAAGATSDLPDNYGYTSSFESYLNAQGVDVGGAYAELADKFGQLPGTGETITNVSIGDLTDASMASDPYVQSYGYTTVVDDGQRYLDVPSMPLIPAYAAESNGTLSGTAAVEGEDPSLTEPLLDFSVMAPLPHDLQRPGATGDGATDLLGIAPGAKYRLVVPQTPTVDQIAVAFLAAANQSPAPDVITASLGFGTDVNGYPGRYLEEDPVIESVIAAITQQDHIVVVDAANDGTRLYTPAAVGPDGGATPTNVARIPGQATNIDDDSASTTPGEVIDSGSIAAGATTTDDTLAIPPGTQGNAWRNPTYATTRTDGTGSFASGFGQRLTLSAPGDSIPSFVHLDGPAEDMTVDLDGGTSAAAPEIAAAAAIVLQTARLTGHPASPQDVIRILQQTGRRVTTPPQADQRLNVGQQIDVTAAVDSLLGHDTTPTAIVRLSVAHHFVIPGTGGGTFGEYSDPGYIDLQGPGTGAQATGQALVGPVTFGADITGSRGDNYALIVGRTRFTSDEPDVRVLPEELLTAAGLPVVSTTDRTISVTFQVRRGDRVFAQLTKPLTLGPTDGTYTEAQAPGVAGSVRAGHSVTVSYNLTGVRNVASPELVVSEAGHWNPELGPVFNAGYTVALTGLSGTVTLPASAFGGGGEGIYGIGIEQDSGSGLYGEFTPVLVGGFSVRTRPQAPTLTAYGSARGHTVAVIKAAPDFTLNWDAGRGAAGAVLEISAPGPTMYNAQYTFNNPNGTQRDADGVDTGSVVYQKLPSAAGSRTFSATALGLASSLSYNVRILPMDASGTVNGQASPTSQLTVNDGLVPSGGVANSFAIAGASSVAATEDSAGSQVVSYNPATGSYGSLITSDDSGGYYDVFGVDPAAHTVLVDHMDSQGTEQAELYDTRTGALIGQPLSGYTFKGGRVDASRNQAALLATDPATGDDDVIAVNMRTGVASPPIDADVSGVSAGEFDQINLDASTGQVYLTTDTGGGPCIGGAMPDADVNMGTGAVTVSNGGSRCDMETAAGGGQLIAVGYHSFSVNIVGTADLSVIDEGTLARTATYALRTGAPIAVAVDGVHHLAAVLFELPPGLTEFGYPAGYISDSNPMSEIDIVDTTTGQVVETIDHFQADYGYGSPFDRATERAVQLDPATRTGYIYGPGETQIQSFSY